MQIFLNWHGSYNGIGHNLPGIQVENGTFYLHGALRNSGFHQITSQIIAVVDAVTEVSASGEIAVSLSRNQGIELRGPEGAVHMIAGRVNTGWLSDTEQPEDARQGHCLRITAGRSLLTNEINDQQTFSLSLSVRGKASARQRRRRKECGFAKRRSAPGVPSRV